MYASDLINHNRKPLVQIKKSNRNGDGLFAKRCIPKDTPVVIYHGDKITDEEIYNLYMGNPEAYHELNRMIRGTGNGFAIRGIKNDNLNLCGAYVNDGGTISCKKEEVNKRILEEYKGTMGRCNLITVDTLDYPVYIAARKIKKGEELLVHYGIGYWLSHLGFTPEELSDLNKRYPFG